MSQTTNDFTTLEGLLQLAMASDNLTKGKQQAASYVDGTFAAGDTITGEATATAVKGKMAVNAYVWGHIKQIDRQTSKAALPEQIGLVIGVPMYNGSVPLFLQALYDGKPMKKLDVYMTNFTQTGDIAIYATLKLKNIRVSSIIQQGYTESGPVCFVACLPEQFEQTIDKKAFSYDLTKSQ